MTQEYIKTFLGKPVGIIEYRDNGDQVAIDFATRKILGYYRANIKSTTDICGRILAKGNTISMFFSDKLTQ